MTKAKIGDYYLVPIGDGYGVVQYVCYERTRGQMIRVLDYFVTKEQEFNIDKAQLVGTLFPPVFTFLDGAITEFGWKKTGNAQVKDFEFPLFLSHWTGDSEFTAKMWFLWDGEETTRLGKRLDKKYKDLEVAVIWSPEILVDRINSGKNPYREMIEKGLEPE